MKKKMFRWQKRPDHTVHARRLLCPVLNSPCYAWHLILHRPNTDSKYKFYTCGYMLKGESNPEQT